MALILDVNLKRLKAIRKKKKKKKKNMLYFTNLELFDNPVPSVVKIFFTQVVYRLNMTDCKSILLLLWYP